MILDYWNLEPYFSNITWKVFFVDVVVPAKAFPCPAIWKKISLYELSTLNNRRRTRFRHERPFIETQLESISSFLFFESVSGKSGREGGKMGGGDEGLNAVSNYYKWILCIQTGCIKYN